MSYLSPGSAFPDGAIEAAAVLRSDALGRLPTHGNGARVNGRAAATGVVARGGPPCETAAP